LNFEVDLFPVHGGGMTYDTARNRMVLFGGMSYALGTGDYFNSGTQEREGTRWLQVSAADPGWDGNPPPQIGAGLAYDPLRAETILYGGIVPTEGLNVGRSDETWAWDGEAWTRLEPEDPEGDGNPPGLDNLSLAYSRANGALLLHGGLTAQGVVSETWLWNGSGWRLWEEKDPEGDGGPGARDEYAMAFDPVSEQVLLYGGRNSQESLDDTWAWTGDSWRRLVPDDSQPDGNPPPLVGAAMACDPVRNRMVLYGGNQAADGEGASARRSRSPVYLPSASAWMPRRRLCCPP